MEIAKTPTLEAAKNYISLLDFKEVIKKLVQHEGWLEKDAKAISEIYKNYLFLKKKYGKEHELPPSDEIDIFWHNHILDTKKYRYDCQNIFGEYFDHYPYYGIDEKSNLKDLQKAFSKMQELYKIEYGMQLKRIRNIYAYFYAFIYKLNR